MPDIWKLAVAAALILIPDPVTTAAGTALGLLLIADSFGVDPAEVIG